jgi:hypothetical protein
MEPVVKVLGSLERVRQVGPGRWLARCPAHPDRDPSLSIREGSGGRVLLHCFAGCPTERVLSALGLTWPDLFPEENLPRTRSERRRRDEARAQAVLEKVWRDISAETASELAGLIQRAGSLLEREGWRAIMEDGPGADYLAELARQLCYWEWLFEEINRRDPAPEAVKLAKEVIERCSKPPRRFSPICSIQGLSAIRARARS